MVEDAGEGRGAELREEEKRTAQLRRGREQVDLAL